jgi:hypothetical protein
MPAALVVSACALLFTLFSFWWMNWRRSSLIVAPPRSFAAAVDATRAIIELPLVFFNPGPTPLIVLNLRLSLHHDGGMEPVPPLAFIATLGKVGTDKDRAFATQFMVKGRDGLALICEFQRLGLALAPGRYTAEILGVMLGQNETWRALTRFPLDLRQLGETFVVHDNMRDA